MPWPAVSPGRNTGWLLIVSSIIVGLSFSAVEEEITALSFHVTGSGIPVFFDNNRGLQSGSAHVFEQG